MIESIWMNILKMNYNSIDLIKNIMTENDIQVISFDVFDTLFMRKTGSFDDLFGLLNKRFRELTGSNLDFGRAYLEADAVLRRAIINGKMEREDIFLEDIYEVISRDYGISKDICDEMMKEELAIEHKVCCQRKSGKALYDFALSTGKKVILTSDMYLRKEHIEGLLRSTGYGEVENLFVSSEVGLRKITGHLYTFISETLGVAPENILHIGDNKKYDVEVPASLGFRTVWFPSAKDTFLSYGCGTQPEKVSRDLVNWEVASKEPGVSIARQMAANKYFDDPFRPFDPDSDYNADPYFVGFAALGPHVFSLVRWIIDQVKRDGAEKMVFLSRDGYLPMQVYNMVRELHPELPEARYLHTSRISLLPFIINTPSDIYQIPVDLNYQTPEKLLARLDFCAKEDAWNIIKQEAESGAYKKDEILSKDMFHRFVADFIRYAYDGEKHEKSREIIRDYLLGNKENSDRAEARVTDKTAIFDSGYSGRIASAIKEATRKDIYVYYIHSDGKGIFMNEGKADINVRTFLDFSPYMEATMREYAYLEIAPSCIGYTEDGNVIYDQGPHKGYGATAEKLQQGAMDFAREFIDTFDGYEKETSCRGLSAALPFEAFLRYCSEADRHMFDGVMIDDELWGGRRDIDLQYLMDARLSKLPEFVKQ